MPNAAQKNWLAEVFGIKLGAPDRAPGKVPAVAAADNAVAAPGSGEESQSDWEKKFYADMAADDARYEKLKEQALRAIDDANRAFEQDQRAPHPSRPMGFYPRFGQFKTPAEVGEIELLENENKIILELHIGAIPDKHQLSVCFINLLGNSGIEASWTFKESGLQTVKANLRYGIYELGFYSDKLPGGIGEGRPIDCVYSLKLEPAAAKKKAAPPRRR